MKKIGILLSVITSLLGVVIIPVNLFLYEMPEYIAVIISALCIAAVVWYYAKCGGKALSKTILTVLAVVSVVFALFGSYCNPYWNLYSKGWS